MPVLYPWVATSVLAALASLWLCAGAAWGQAGPLPLAVPPAQQQAIRKVIEAQEDAFKRDDAAGAFRLASPGIQAQFGTPERFLDMVRTMYEAVYRPRVMRFLDAVATPAGVVQRVIYIGPDGLQVLALYPMLHMDDGSWRTDGCYLMSMPGDSA